MTTQLLICSITLPTAAAASRPAGNNHVDVSLHVQARTPSDAPTDGPARFACRPFAARYRPALNAVSVARQHFK